MDVGRLEFALTSISSLCPVIGGRYRRRPAADGFEHFVAFTFTNSPIMFSVGHSSLSAPFADPDSVLQFGLKPFVDTYDT